MRTYIQARKRGDKPSQVGGADLLSILLEDNLIFNNEERVIDQLLDFFVAGTQTVALSSQHLIHRLAIDDNLTKLVRDDIQSNILEPYLKEEAEGK